MAHVRAARRSAHSLGGGLLAAMVIVYIFFACLLVVAIGDPLFASAMRKHAPSAFAAAGSPSSGNLAILTPFFFSPYHRFIVRRSFRSHLAPGSMLYYVATLLHIAHVLIIVLAVVMAVWAAALWVGK